MSVQQDSEQAKSEVYPSLWDVVIIGGGIAGLSAAIYLGRAQKNTLVLDDGHSMAFWPPKVENFLGFAEGISGEELLHEGRKQATISGAHLKTEQVSSVSTSFGEFIVDGRSGTYRTRRLLLATGIFHIPPDIPGVPECLGHSMFFCKDCDGLRVKGKRVLVFGWNNEAVEVALAMLSYSPAVSLVTNGRSPRWNPSHAAWLREYFIPVYGEPVEEVEHANGQLEALRFADGSRLKAEAIFTTRGDIVHNTFARSLGAVLDDLGQVIVDPNQQTNIPGLYAAGCMTPSNCQMIIAAGQGAIAAQAINRSLFEESLSSHSLKQFHPQEFLSAPPQHMEAGIKP